MTWVLIWLVGAIVVGIAANVRGRIGIGYFFLSLLISPLLGLVLVLVLPDKTKPSLDTHIKCPHCAELVLPEASRCKHCQAELTPQPARVKTPLQQAIDMMK